jgi:FixJ family two-component response regulator
MTQAVPIDCNATVFVVENDLSARNAFNSLICSAGWLARSFASVQEILAQPRALIPGCVVLNICVPDRTALDMYEQVVNRIGLPVIVITDHSDVPTTVRIMKAGAFELLTKPFQKEPFLSAVSSAINFSRPAVRREAEVQELRRLYASLSLREQEVMALVVRGQLNKLIAASLEISEITVKAHRGKVMRKMAAGSLAQLVIIATELGMTRAGYSGAPSLSSRDLQLSFESANAYEPTQDSWSRFPKIAEQGEQNHRERTVYGGGDHPQAA